jgi:hypothetical protein
MDKVSRAFMLGAILSAFLTIAAIYLIYGFTARAWIAAVFAFLSSGMVAAVVPEKPNS